MTQTLQPPSPHAAPPDAIEGLSPPVIILGGGANALSVARNLGRLGARVHALDDASSYVRYSRYCRRIALPDATPQGWLRFLLGPESEPHRGAVLLACSDAALTLLAEHREALAPRYRLDDSNPHAQLLMLNKLATYQEAREAGVPTPRFWLADTREQVLALEGSLSFPLIVKPHYTHDYEQRTGRKFELVQNFDDALRAYDALRARGIATLLVEWIPGPDDRLCSYYTYLDADGEPLFHFTKRIIRRFPVGWGNACYHVTDWNPEVRDQGLKLFQAVGLRGLANAEFKRDARDGQLKLIECNARFTASDCLVARSGFDLAAVVYNRLAGRPQARLERYTEGKRLWEPLRDFQCFLALRRRGEITFGQWLASILHLQTFPYFEWTDPLPALAKGWKPLRTIFRGISARAKYERNPDACRPRPESPDR